MKSRNSKVGIVIGVLALVLSSWVVAAVPKLINFEGKLTDSDNNPITGTKSIQFKIYTVETGGTPVWNETQSVTLDSKGFYSVLLGSEHTLDVDFNTDYWLGITVESDSEMTPRYRLASVGSAINADMVDGKHASEMVTKIVAGTNVNISPTTGVGEVTIDATDGGGGGDMLKSTYDTNTNNIVDNSEKLGGNSPGNSSGNIPISNGTVCTNLNADKLDGKDESAFASASHNHIGETWSGSQAAHILGLDNTHTGGLALWARSAGSEAAIYGDSTGSGGPEYPCGVEGLSVNGAGVRGKSTNSYGGIFWTANSSSYALMVKSAGAASGNPGLQVIGSVSITGTLNKGGGSFLIDHPLDPQNKILRHSFVESPEMTLIYKGRAKLKNGEVTVHLPEYFDALNHPEGREINLTCVNGWSSLYLEGRIENNQFTVKTTSEGNPEQEFSWIIYGVRNDAFARKNPITVQQVKGEGNNFTKGEYIYPEAFGCASNK